jgi:hypothetical protein
MTRLSLSTLLATMLAGPWVGCDREPVTPPAAPPPERAPEALDGGPSRDFGGLILLDDARRRG